MAELKLVVNDKDCVTLSGKPSTLKKFLNDWQTSRWPTWQTDLNANGTNAAIRQVSKANRYIDEDCKLTLSTSGEGQREAFLEAISLFLE